MVDSSRQLKGLILSGGKGSRLRPFTYTGAKQLIPLANKPVLFYAIENMRDAGIEEIGIVIGDTGDQVREAVGDGSALGVRVTYIEQDAPRGIAHGIRIAEDFIGNAAFALYLGDNFILGGIDAFAEEFRNGNASSQILLHPVENPQDFGVAVLQGEQVVKVVEKPKTPPSNLAVIGIYFFDQDVFKAVNSIQPSARGELEITDTIQWLIDNAREVRADSVRGYWIDTGKMADILEANRMVLDTLEAANRGSVEEGSRIEGKVVIEEGASIVNSVVRGPAIIGRNTRIVESYVGPFTSIYHDCLVLNSEISSSIVLENTTIESVGQRIEDSMIGRNVELIGGNTKPRGYRLTLGDHSRVQAP